MATLFPLDDAGRTDMLHLWDTCASSYQFYSILACKHRFPNIVAPSAVDSVPDAPPPQGTVTFVL